MRIIYGAGGHGTVVLDTVRAMGIEPDGFVDDGRIGQTICGLPVLGGATWLEHHPLASVWLGIGYNEVRRRVGEALIEAGHPLLQAIHPFSWVSPRADVGAGVVVFAGAAINTGGVSRGDSVAVFGCGGVGNAALEGSRLAGASTIIAVDIDDTKLEWAKQFGATHTINSSREDAVERIRELTGGNGVDVAIEAIGLPQTYEQAFYARDLAGTVVLVGVPNPEMKIELPYIELFGRGGALKSSWYGDCLPSRDFPMLIDLYLQGRLNLDGFVSETIDLDAVEEAFHKMEGGGVLRSVVVL